jgi:hypothetical protein
VSTDGTAFKRLVTLEPGQESLIEASVDVPAEAAIGMAADLILNVSSKVGGLSKAATRRMRVAEADNSGPTLGLIFHRPTVPLLGQDITFSASLFDPENDPLAEAKICRNPSCTEQWCDLGAKGLSAGTFNCTTRPPVGNWSYFLRATDMRGAATTSDVRKFAVRIRAPLSTDNIACNATARASSSLPGQGPERATDCNLNTYWQSGLGLPQSLTIDLGRTEPLGGYGLFSEAPSRPSSFVLETSADCATFKRSHEERAGRFAKDGYYRASLGPAWARCVRLTIDKVEDGSGYMALAELELYRSEQLPVEPRPGEGPPGAPTAPPFGALAAAIIVLAVIAAALVFRKRIAFWLSYARG